MVSIGDVFEVAETSHRNVQYYTFTFVVHDASISYTVLMVSLYRVSTGISVNRLSNRE